MHAGTSMISDRKQGADPTQGHVQLCALVNFVYLYNKLD
ncbi:hypothetical protein J2126_001524 [Xanthobacter flavus]|nr:hypothetical protein [Xanthobacter flavus]